MIKHYKYIGKNPHFVGHTALGRFAADIFLVQIDNLKHSFATGWHSQLRSEWEEIP